MKNPHRKLAFVLAATNQGTLIVNRFDYNKLQNGQLYGVGIQLLNDGSFDMAEVELICGLLDFRRQYQGSGVVALDCGANIGVHTVEIAKHLTGWGSIIAVEAQERLYYALAGNIALNNCFNARAIHAAVTHAPGTMKMPVPDYLNAGSFGSLELKPLANAEFIGQAVDYSQAKMVEVPTVSIDSLDLARVDLIKIDIEGMEPEALGGGMKTITAQRPVLVVEHKKTDKAKLQATLEKLGYAVFDCEWYFIGVHRSDKCLAHVKSVT